jgi:hypothetical protein
LAIACSSIGSPLAALGGLVGAGQAVVGVAVGRHDGVEGDAGAAADQEGAQGVVDPRGAVDAALVEEGEGPREVDVADHRERAVRVGERGLRQGGDERRVVRAGQAAQDRGDGRRVTPPDASAASHGS